MPIIYLSPSTQENNLYVNGGTEEEWMNRLADAMEERGTKVGFVLPISPHPVSVTPATPPT